ncbi:MAG: hypothetical protein JSV27_04255 [Candidatus Bathyarchaeota archaeon]|nr:MAG: hypothetical protein JSV27_04255 [Candidatus Bathyarchaeota archaeon]
MTCYFRHMKDVFSKAGIEVTKENKKALDEAIHSYVGVEYKDCSSTWREVKKKLAEDEEAFIAMLMNA